MSRTIRRKNVKPDHWVTHNRTYVVRDLGDGWVWKEWCYVPFEGKELQQRLAMFHGDHGYSTYYYTSTGGRRVWEKGFQKTHRQQAKRELHRFLKDTDYEVMVAPNRPFLDYWD